MTFKNFLRINTNPGVPDTDYYYDIDTTNTFATNNNIKTIGCIGGMADDIKTYLNSGQNFSKSSIENCGLFILFDRYSINGQDKDFS